MVNLVLITSVIKPPNKRLSYSPIRSIFSNEERFQQTINTILSIKQQIPNNVIIIVECSDLNKNENDYLKNNCDYVLNLWNNKNIHPNIFNVSKSLGEGTMTIEALTYIKTLNIKADVMYKISGRYWLNEKFKLYNEPNVFKLINNNANNAYTVLYKLDINLLDDLKLFLIKNEKNMNECIGFEVLISNFIKNIKNIKIVDNMGISGLVTINGNFHSG